MNSRAISVLSRRYATAFLAVFGDTVTLDQAHAFDAAASFFRNNSLVLFFLRLPMLKKRVKSQALDEVIDRFGLPESTKRLVALLIVDKRTALLPNVCAQIAAQYRTQHAIILFHITSSHALQEKALEIITTFLERKTHKKVLYTHAIDPALIAGIRAQNDALLWEDSIQKRLSQIEASLIH